MYINESDRNNAIVLELSGRLDSVGASELEESLARACEGASRAVVLDMSDVGYVNSSGLRVLARFLKLSQEKNCDLRLFGMTDNVDRALEMVGLDAFFPKYDSLQEALS